MMQPKLLRRLPARAMARQRGITLIELMVAMLIGLLLTLAMVSALTFGEGQKRTTSAASGMDQSGAYAASVLDTALRNAGSGLTQASGIIGCKPGFAGTLSGTPFEAFDTAVGGVSNLIVAPVLIARNPSSSSPASDVLVVMSGAGMAGGVSRAVTDVTGNQVTFSTNSIGITAPSLALVAPSAGGNCFFQSVASVDSSTQVTLTAPLSLLLGAGSVILPLGNPATGDVQFQLLGVDAATGTLYGYDLLPNDANRLQPLTGNVLAMQALYGINNGSSQIGQWVEPAGDWAIASLQANPDRVRQILAIRVALILKSTLYEKDEVAAAAPVWFNPDRVGTPQATDVPQTLDLSAITDGAHYRYRVVEFVVPVRNNPN